MKKDNIEKFFIRISDYFLGFSIGWMMFSDTGLWKIILFYIGGSIMIALLWALVDELFGE